MNGPFSGSRLANLREKRPSQNENIIPQSIYRPNSRIVIKTLSTVVRLVTCISALDGRYGRQNCN